MLILNFNQPHFILSFDKSFASSTQVGNSIVIVFTYSGLASKEVFSFQKPGPLQFSSISFNSYTIAE